MNGFLCLNVILHDPRFNVLISDAHCYTLVSPGCRYGCICHLCNGADIYSENASLQFDPQLPSPPLPKPASHSSPPCGKVHCRLGCVCDSLSGPVTAEPAHKAKHCGRPECMFVCNCQRKTRSVTKSLLWSGTGESDSDRSRSPIVTQVQKDEAHKAKKEVVEKKTKDQVQE